ncbi:hypothetical protein ACWGI0_11930 [Streptomyces sp. NPDC054802]
MTAAALRPAAVPRALRRAVSGPWTLRVLLILGGVLTLGLLFGAPAYAAEAGAGAAAPARADVRPEGSADASAESRSAGTQAQGQVSTETGVSGSVESESAGPAARLDTDEPAAAGHADEPRRVADRSAPAVGTATAVPPATAAGVEPTVEAVREATRPVPDDVTGPTRQLIGAVAGPLPAAPLPSGPLPAGRLPVPGGVVVPGDGPAAGPAPGYAPFTTGPAPGYAPFTTEPGGSALAMRPAHASADAGHAAAMGIGRYCGERSGHPGAALLASADSPAHSPVPGPVDPCEHRQGVVQHSGETHTPRAGDQPAATSDAGAADAFGSAPGCPAAEPPTRDRPRDVLEFPG